ncbi:MAG TPA: glucose 1-dehydrogenase [Bryobacteraceae bacterium]|jgi:glucose 1-dehydrogenase|nr:glucose 1-dehydrogenase [Bryobacteraceae bacterium]
MKLKGKKALITGASSGIGKAIAIRFAAEGATVAVNYLRDEDQAEGVLDNIRVANPGGHISVKADVSEEAEVLKMFETTIASFGQLDIVVNNAGIQKPEDSHDVSMQDFEKILGVNLTGAFMCAREGIRHFLERKIPGVILNNSSVHEIIPKPKYLPYSLSKGGMRNLTKTLALEYADRGIRVNAVGPGAVITPINIAWTNDAQAKAVVESHIPMGRAAQPEEIASVFAFLASDDASYITGQTIFACGGLTLYPEFRTAWASGE